MIKTVTHLPLFPTPARRRPVLRFVLTVALPCLFIAAVAILAGMLMAIFTTLAFGL